MHEGSKDLSSREDDPYRDKALGWGIAPLINLERTRAACALRALDQLDDECVCV